MKNSLYFTQLQASPFKQYLCILSPSHVFLQSNRKDKSTSVSSPSCLVFQRTQLRNVSLHTIEDRTGGRRVSKIALWVHRNPDGFPDFSLFFFERCGIYFEKEISGGILEVLGFKKSFSFLGKSGMEGPLLAWTLLPQHLKPQKMLQHKAMIITRNRNLGYHYAYTMLNSSQKCFP